MAKRQPAPADLADRFQPAEDAKFRVLRADGSTRLWQSRAKPRHPGASRASMVRYHVTVGDRAVAVLMSSWELAIGNFEWRASTFMNEVASGHGNMGGMSKQYSAQ